MKPDTTAQRLIAAHNRVMDAQKALIAATKRALPVGTIVEVTLGRATVTGIVESHSDCYYSMSAGEITIRNLQTDKPRSFSPWFAFKQGELVIVKRPRRQRKAVDAPPAAEAAE